MSWLSLAVHSCSVVTSSVSEYIFLCRVGYQVSQVLCLARYKLVLTMRISSVQTGFVVASVKGRLVYVPESIRGSVRGCGAARIVR
jgi:hypothetical protein